MGPMGPMRPACKYNSKSKGCKDGALCDHCHLCRWKRHPSGSGAGPFLSGLFPWKDFWKVYTQITQLKLECIHYTNYASFFRIAVSDSPEFLWTLKTQVEFQEMHRWSNPPFSVCMDQNEFTSHEAFNLEWSPCFLRVLCGKYRTIGNFFS